MVRINVRLSGQHKCHLCFECKREAVKPTDEDNGVGQLHSYLAASVHCRFGMRSSATP